MCPEFCQHHIIFIIVTLQPNLKSWIVMSPAFLFWPIVTFDIQVLFWFHACFRIIFSSTTKMVSGILIGFVLNMCKGFRSIDIDLIGSACPETGAILLFSDILLNILSSDYCRFHGRVFPLL